MEAKDYIKQFTTDNPNGMISYESIIELMEGYAKVYHEDRIKDAASNPALSDSLSELLIELKERQTPNDGGAVRPIDYDVYCVRRTMSIISANDSSPEWKCKCRYRGAVNYTNTKGIVMCGHCERPI